MIGFARRALLAATVAFACLTAAQAQEALRPEVGKPLQKAVALLRAGRYADASAQVRAASAVRGLTAAESLTIERLRGSIAEGSKDYKAASQIYADLLAKGSVPAAERLRMLSAEVSMSFYLNNPAAVESWAEQYYKAGGTDPEPRKLETQAYYQAHQYDRAEKLEGAQIAAESHAGQRPTEAQLQLMAASQQALHDDLGFGNTMVQLVTYYPKPDYWQNLIHAAQTRPGFNDRLTLDIDRFELAIGVLNKPADLMEMTELALQVPLPGEAKSIIDAAFTKGTLGTGPEASRQQRLRALVQKTYDDNKDKLDGRVAAAQGEHDGNPLVSLGEEMNSYGMYTKGIPLVLAGMKKGSLRHPDDAKLHLGLAYMNAGQKAQAIAWLRSVGGKEGAAEIARLWLIRIGKA